jgi:hypothetical protein
MSIPEFLAILEKGPADPDGVFNPWRDHDDRDAPPRRDSPRRRRENMAAYLLARERSARVLLLGEAPSHRGCRFTGIAFCSEVELVHKRDLVARERLALTSAAARDKPMRERSAAVIWDELDRAGCAREVVLWNAFPWHPHGETVTSNRKPRHPEVAQGRRALEALLSCFSHRLSVFAVGKVAEDALRRWDNSECTGYIRHPAQGGEAKFRAQFRQQVAAPLQLPR